MHDEEEHPLMQRPREQDNVMRTHVETLDHYNSLPVWVGGYRVKEEKANKIIELVKDAFLRQHTSPGHPEAPQPHSWSITAALERMKNACCTADPHAQERRSLESEIQDLKRRRAVAAKLLDEVEQEVEVIQNSLQERIQRRGHLEKLLPRNCWRAERPNDANLQGGGFELRRALRARLDSTLAAGKTRDEELRQVYAALRGRDEELAKMRQQQFATSASPAVQAGMQKYFRGGKVLRLGRAFEKVEMASLHIVLIVWQQYFRQCCFVERVCRLLTKVLESTRYGVEGVDPLIYKLRALRNQVPPAESWELLNALDWTAGSMTHSPTSVQQPIMAITDVDGGHGPWYTGGRGRRNERMAIERQLLNRFFTTTMGRNLRASARTIFAGWKLRAHQQSRAKRILMRNTKSWAKGSTTSTLVIVFTSWHHAIQRGKTVLHQELLAGMRTRQNELEDMLSPRRAGSPGGQMDFRSPDARRDARSDGSSRSPTKARDWGLGSLFKAEAPKGKGMTGPAGPRSHIVELGTSMSGLSPREQAAKSGMLFGPNTPQARPGSSGSMRDTGSSYRSPGGPMRDTGSSYRSVGAETDTGLTYRGMGGQEAAGVWFEGDAPRSGAAPAVAASARPPLRVVIESARGLRKADWMGKSDPYCVCTIPGKPQEKLQTPYLDSTLAPVWNYVGVLLDYAEGDSLEFSVWDRDPPPKKDDLLGRAILNSSQLAAGFSGELQLLETKGVQSFLTVTVHFMDAGMGGQEGAGVWSAAAASGSGAAPRRQRAAEPGPPPSNTMMSPSSGRGPGQFTMPTYGETFSRQSSPDRMTPAAMAREQMGGDRGGSYGEWGAPDFQDDLVIAPPPPDDIPELDNPVFGGSRKGDPQQTNQRRPAGKGALRTGKGTGPAQPTQRGAIRDGNTAASKVSPKAKSVPKAAERTAAGQQYTVFLDRATDDSLGIEVRHDTERDAIVITKVTGGLAGRWNDENPGEQIRQGDCIMEVNGIQGPVQALLERCRVDEVLMVTLGR